MSKFVLVCLSFMAGVLTTLAVLGFGRISAQAPPPAQRPNPNQALSPSPLVPDTDPDGKPRGIWSQITMSNIVGIRPLQNLEDIPKFDPLNSRPILKNGYFSKEVQVLDGLDCRTCTFDNANLVYGGGPFNLENTQFTGQVSLQFVGAAANTIGMMKLTGLLKEEEAAIPQPEINKPVVETTIIKRQKAAPKVGFGTPYMGKMKR